MKYRYLILPFLLPLSIDAAAPKKDNTCARLANATLFHYTLSRNLPVPFMEFKKNETTATALQGFAKRVQRKPDKLQSFTTYTYKYSEVGVRYAQLGVPDDLTAKLLLSYVKRDGHIFIDYAYTPIENDPPADALKYKLRQGPNNTCDLVHISESNGRIIYHDGFCRALLPDITSYSKHPKETEAKAYERLKSFQDEVGKEHYFFLRLPQNGTKIENLIPLEKSKFQNLLANCQSAMEGLGETGISFPTQQKEEPSVDEKVLINYIQPTPSGAIQK